MLGGPAGAAAGAAIGATGGLAADAVGATFDADFVAMVSREVRPGQTAVVMEANEGGTRAVDNIVKLNGGTVHRSDS